MSNSPDSSIHLLLAASLLALSGCTAQIVHETPCVTDDECASAFGLGASCLDNGLCATDGDDSIYNGVSSSMVRTVGMADITGPLQDLGFGIRDGVNAAMTAWNTDHPNSRQFVYEFRDDQYNPEMSAEIVDEITADAGDGTGRYAFAVLCPGGSPTSAAMLPILNERQVPIVGTYSGADHLRLDPPDRIVFNTRASYRREAETITRHLLAKDPYPVPPQNIFAYSQSPSDGDTDGLADAAPDAVGADQTALDAFGNSGYLGIVDALADELETQTDIPLGTYRGRTTNTAIAEEFFFEWVSGLSERLPGVVTDSGDLQVGIAMVGVASGVTPFILGVIDGVEQLHDGGKPDQLSQAQWDLVDPERKTALQSLNVSFASISPVGDQLTMNLAAAGASTYCSGDYPIVVSQVVPFPTGSSAGAIAYQRDLKAYDPALQPGFVSFETWIASQVWIAAVEETEAEGDLNVDNLIDTMTSDDFSVELGIGQPIEFSLDNHDGSNMVFGSTLDTDCSYLEYAFAE